MLAAMAVRRLHCAARVRSLQRCSSSTPTHLGASVEALRNVAAASELHQQQARHGSSRLLLAAALAAAAAAAAASTDRPEACGIVGVVGHKTGHSQGTAREMLLEGLSILRNRGYDSAGLATIDPEGNVVVSKFASRGSTADSIDLLRNNSESHIGHAVGIAHTRWATHGGKTDKNAHPHMDFNNRIALVHNGTINNANDLRRDLVSKGIDFRSETDTEVIAQLIGWELHENPALTLKEATALSLAKCDGTWGLAVVSKDQPDEIVVACSGSPMVIGLGQDNIFVASETSAFSRYTKNFIAMKDGEIGTISANSCDLDISRVQVAPNEHILLDPAPYPHWTIRECLQQPEAIARALAFGGRMADDRVVLGGPDRSAAKLQAVKHLVLTACGTSLYAAQYGARLMRDLESLDTAVARDAAELMPQDIPKRGGGLLVVSQSGETRDVFKALKHAELAGVPRLSCVNVVGSAIARETKLGVYLNAGREQAVASTKSFTTQVTVLALLALWFRQLREGELASASTGDTLAAGLTLPDKSQLMEALQRLPISFGMAMRVRPRCKEIAQRLKDARHCFVLGKGYGESVALEGALKLKEMAYLHAEGYSGGALKHGPFALLEEMAYLHAEGYSGGALKHRPFALLEGKDGDGGPTPIILLILDDEHAHQMRTAGEEVKARGADVFVITDNPRLAEGLDPTPIVIPSNGQLTALIGVLPLQLIAYELAVLRGINPDVPRNLAKAVTTD